jgi:hypothetical protein
MTVTTIKAEKVVSTALALLDREVVLPGTVWRDAAGDFRGAKDDTISIRLPSYTSARKNTLRAGSARTRDALVERKVDVTLTSRLYKDIEVTDENFTLDILDFTAQVMAPCLRSIVRGYEDEVADLMEGATYQVEIELNEADPLNGLRSARKALNNASVPQSDRFLAFGSDVEEAVLNAQTFQENVARTGDATALRDAAMGRIAGFTPFVSNALEPDEAYAYHRTAYVLNTRAPMVPAGAPWGATLSEGGFAIRAVQVLDPTDIVNILATEAWVGSNVVTDHGSIDAKGKFVPSADPENPVTPAGHDAVQSARFVRAVKLALPAS